MPAANPLPRKYLSTLRTVQEELRLIAQKSRAALQEVEARRPPYTQTKGSLQDIETIAYRLAYELSQMQTAVSCDDCPSAPPTTTAQAHLLVLANTLTQQAEEARNLLESSPMLKS